MHILLNPGNLYQAPAPRLHKLEAEAKLIQMRPIEEEIILSQLLRKFFIMSDDRVENMVFSALSDGFESI